MGLDLIIYRRQKPEGFAPEVKEWCTERGRDSDGCPELDCYAYEVDAKSEWHEHEYRGQSSIRVGRHERITEALFAVQSAEVYQYPKSWGDGTPSYWRPKDWATVKDRVKEYYLEYPERGEWWSGLLDTMEADPDLYFYLSI